MELDENSLHRTLLLQLFGLEHESSMASLHCIAAESVKSFRLDNQQRHPHFVPIRFFSFLSCDIVGFCTGVLFYQGPWLQQPTDFIVA